MSFLGLTALAVLATKNHSQPPNERQKNIDKISNLFFKVSLFLCVLGGAIAITGMITSATVVGAPAGVILQTVGLSMIFLAKFAMIGGIATVLFR